ncbi:hypothetical protein [Nitrosomonas sp. Nm33]|uniref:hypothetical protein n=1 Tax=Nitrosomonas sp. Nm33 TaxID=133724 RepID=UPI00089A00B1|nr:hypothetical protein [Nitrosomonas sp. Nm33]SDZ03409.1 hypothetical protein SAMN05421755_10887 [Nitrosomonas sp. Nm33]
MKRDYSITDNPMRSTMVHDFENIQHHMSLEGIGTVINLGLCGTSSSVSPFLENYLPATYLRHYLPLAILNVNERSVLGHLSSAAGRCLRTLRIHLSWIISVQRARYKSVKASRIRKSRNGAG